MSYEQKLKAHAILILERIVSGEEGYDDSDLRDCMEALFGK